MTDKPAAIWKNITRHPQNNDLLARPLHDFSFTLASGSIQGFIGEKGTGNITSIHLLLRLLQPDSGEIKVFSRISGNEIADKIGFCPEQFNTFPGVKSRKILRLFGKLKSNPPRFNSFYLQQLEINDLLDIKFSNLSINHKKCLGLATALLNDPQLLILIEPTEGLAPDFQEKLYELINHRHSGNHKTTLIATSRVNLARRLCTHTINFEQDRF